MPVFALTIVSFPAIDSGLNLSGDQSLPKPSGVIPFGLSLSNAPFPPPANDPIPVPKSPPPIAPLTPDERLLSIPPADS